MLDNGLCPITKVSQVGEADAIDPRGITTFPATPDQPRHIEKERGVVRHSKKHKTGSGKTISALVMIGAPSQDVVSASTIDAFGEPTIPSG